MRSVGKGLPEWILAVTQGTHFRATRRLFGDDAEFSGADDCIPLPAFGGK